ncbi:MAG: NADH-quinone oxidoreductase subunit C [Ruminiclostridium sp.]|nr:NADH-quinone oxidoreductase subunit C [Ruminiclostridium sp.]
MSSLSENLFSALKGEYPEKIEIIENSNSVIVLDTVIFADVINKVKEYGFDFLVDITALEEERLSCVYHFLSLADHEMIGIKARLDDKLEIPSLSREWLSANVQEREVFDMFGIKFTGHPDLKRILCSENFIGHPLRKNYIVTSRR